MEDLERSAEALSRDDGLTERVYLRPVPDINERGIYATTIKPLLDRFVGITMSIITLPIVVAITAAIWATMGRPAIFKQVRVGHFGREFTIYKFRTMEADRRASTVPIDHAERRVNHKSDTDPRHTALGRFLRKWSLDEIPQFWNVAIGDMSLIGPRPELPEIVARYEPWQHRRHEVKPGLTGLWQVSARGDIPMHEATDIDIAYVEGVSFMADLEVLLRTPSAVLGTQQGN